MSILRGLAIPIGAVATVLLFLLFNPWLVIEDADASPDPDGRLLDRVHRLAHRSVRGSQEPREQGDRDRGTGVHAVPLRQLPRRSVLAADPPLRRASPGSRPAGTSSPIRSGRKAEPPCEPTGSGPLRSRSRAGRRSRSSGIATSSTLLLNANAEPWMAWVVTLGELAVGVGLILGAPDGRRRLLRGVDEHVVPARRLSVDEPRPVHPRDRADPRLEGRRLLRPRPLPAPDASGRHGAPEPSPSGASPARRRAEPAGQLPKLSRWPATQGY